MWLIVFGQQNLAAGLSALEGGQTLVLVGSMPMALSASASASAHFFIVRKMLARLDTEPAWANMIFDQNIYKFV